MCLWIYCCGMAAHFWWITRVSSLRFSCSSCARTLHFSKSNMWLIGLKFKTFAGHLSFSALFATSIISYCASSHVTWCVVLCQHHTEICTDMKKKNRPNDVISIPHHSYVSLNGYTWRFRVHENAWARSVMLICAIFNVFHNRQSTRNFPTNFDNHLAMHEEPEHISYFLTYHSA